MRQPRPCFQRFVFAWAGRGRQGERPGVRTCSVRPRTRCCDRRQGMPATADRSTGAVWAMGWLLGGGGWPPGQLPPAMDHPPPAPAARWASATRKPCLGGLLSPFGDALVGQHLAQPGMLVVHVPSLPAAQPSLFQRQVSGRQGCGTDPFGEQDCPSPMAGFASRSGRGDASRPTAAAGAQPEDLARRRGQRSSSAGVHAPPPSSRLPDSRRKSPGRSSRWRSCGHGAAMHPRRADPSTWPTVLGVASRRRAARLPPRPRSTADQRRVQAWSMLWRRRRRGASAAPRCRRRGARASTRMLEPTPASRRSPRPARARCRQGLPRLARVHHDRRRAAAAARPPPPVARTAAVAAPQQPAPAITGGVSGTGGRSPAHR
jgi:hypothetical protein